MKIAIINSDYQIIWEKVIMNRHPEAKNLKQALEKESEIFGSVAVVILSENGAHSWETEATFIVEGYPCSNHSAYYFETQSTKIDLLYQSYNEAIGRVDDYYTKRILGRPITLEDVLVLLTKNGEQYSHQALKWQLTEPLHAQKLEVWELIAEEIKKLEGK
jgi:hypothetical protein